MKGGSVTERKNKIVVVSGKQFSGKDTMAKILVEMLPGFRFAPLAGAIKEQFAKEKNITLEEIEKNKPVYRPELIALGDAGRKQDPDYWIKKVIETDDNIIVPDARLQHEIKIFEKYGAIKIRVEADMEQRAKRGQLVKEDDPTETDLDYYDNWDYVLTNNGTYEELKQKVEELVRERLNILWQE